MGYTPLEVSKERRGISSIEFGGKKVKLKQLAVFSRQFVVPQFKSIYGQLGGSLPVPTKVLLLLSDIFKKLWWLLILGAFGARFMFRRFKATDNGRALVDRVKLRIPVFGSLFHKTALSRFASTLSMLMHAGVPILGAL